MFSIRINPQIKDAQRSLEKVKEVTRDLSPFWRGACREFLIRRFRRVFVTNGYGRWERRKDNLPHHLLRKTRRMYRSYTRAGARDNINKVSEKEFVWGTETPYAHYHETGTERMVARPVVGFIVARRGFGRALEREAEKYFEGAING